MTTLCCHVMADIQNVKAGANFLKSLQEIPQYVCTCCHCVLFHKTVKPFKIGEYDMTNDIVQKCLFHYYRMTLQKSVPGEKMWKLSIMSGQV